MQDNQYNQNPYQNPQDFNNPYQAPVDQNQGQYYADPQNQIQNPIQNFMQDQGQYSAPVTQNFQSPTQIPTQNPQYGAAPLPTPSHNPYQGQQAQNPQLPAQNAQNIQNAQNPQNPQDPNAQQPKVKNPNSTQSTLNISELRDSMVIMKDGSFRAVIACKSINFDLMSEAEREGVEYAYQNFLNSLNFTTQILIRSQRIDIAPYIDKLIDIRRNNDNMLLGVLMDDYINFIDVLSQEANIMDKSFFITIPYYTSKEQEEAIEQNKNFFSTMGRGKNTGVVRIDRTTYDKAITEINNRVETVVSGLFQMGINAVRLNTKELGTLYYNFNNPDTAVREPLGDFNKLAHLYVKKGERNSEVQQ